MSPSAVSHADEAIIDIVAGGYDAGVRLGETIMISLRLTPPFKAVMVASSGPNGSTDQMHRNVI